MHKSKLYPCIAVLGFCLVIASCKVPAITQATENKTVPGSYGTAGDTNNTASLPWRRFFTDQNLVNLIDTALVRNQELNITFQEIAMSKNDILSRQGSLRPYLSARLSAGVEKVGRYTSQGAGDASTEIKQGVEVPDVLSDFSPNLYASWEVDIWKNCVTQRKRRSPGICPP